MTEESKIDGRSEQTLDDCVGNVQAILRDPRDMQRPVATEDEYFSGLTKIETICLPLLIIMFFVLPFVAFFDVTINIICMLPSGGEETSKTIFPRLGSISTIGALMVEFRLKVIQGSYWRGRKMPRSQRYISKKELALTSKLEYLILFVLVFGTIIWEFGELFIS